MSIAPGSSPGAGPDTSPGAAPSDPNRDTLHGALAELLRIPPAPEAPAGAPGSLRTFRASRGYYRYLLLQWGSKQLVGAIGLAGAFAALQQIDAGAVTSMLRVIELFGLLTYLAQLPLTFLLVRLDYQFRWYMVTDRSLRIREGLVRVREQTMSFANIQNMAIRQGPVQRLFGISDLEVRTAGGGDLQPGHEATSSHMHLGYFRGVEDPVAIREVILVQLRRVRDAGLGDPDVDDSHDPGDPGHASHEDQARLLPAARELLAAVRDLRASGLTRPS